MRNHPPRMLCACLPLLLGFGLAAGAAAQSPPDTRAFEVLSFKYAGGPHDHETARGRDTYMTWKPPELRGTRFSADAPLSAIIRFAFLRLLSPSDQAVPDPERFEYPDWTRMEYYRIDAITPPGTDLDGARAMLRTALVKRLGLQYHLADRQTPIYYLVRASGPLKLAPSPGPDPPGGSLQTTWAFHYKAVDLPSFAHFLNSVVGCDVIDKTGIQGKYQFDIDWRMQMQELGGDIRTGGIRVADDGLRPFGLKLLAGKELRKILVVDRANKIPTPN